MNSGPLWLYSLSFWTAWAAQTRWRVAEKGWRRNRGGGREIEQQSWVKEKKNSCCWIVLYEESDHKYDVWWCLFVYECFVCLDCVYCSKLWSFFLRVQKERETFFLVLEGVSWQSLDLLLPKIGFNYFPKLKIDARDFLGEFLTAMGFKRFWPCIYHRSRGLFLRHLSFLHRICFNFYFIGKLP